MLDLKTILTLKEYNMQHKKQNIIINSTYCSVRNIMYFVIIVKNTVNLISTAILSLLILFQTLLIFSFIEKLLILIYLLFIHFNLL